MVDLVLSQIFCIKATMKSELSRLLNPISIRSMHLFLISTFFSFCNAYIYFLSGCTACRADDMKNRTDCVATHNSWSTKLNTYIRFHIILALCSANMCAFSFNMHVINLNSYGKFILTAEASSVKKKKRGHRVSKKKDEKMFIRLFCWQLETYLFILI